MSWLLFMDESGHDHKQMPYEVRGGIAIHARNLWPFIQDVERLQTECFGALLADFKSEIKGTKLLDSDRFRWAAQKPPMDPHERRKHARSFLMKGMQKMSPAAVEFAAYGQASIELARGVFQALRDREAVLFAAAVPRGAADPPVTRDQSLLRKDHIFLLERFFYFLEAKREHGLLVMDEVEKNNDLRFIRRLHDYFTKSQPGRLRTQWIVPTPLFVKSDMSYPVQAADLCIYCVNWGFRAPGSRMTAPARPEISREFESWLRQLQFQGDGYAEGRVFRTFGILCVPDLFTSRTGLDDRPPQPEPGQK